MAVDIDLDALRRNIGRTMSVTDTVSAGPANLNILVFDLDMAPLAAGDPLPEGWHNLYFLPAFRRAALGADGTPKDTGVIPEMPLPRRMYAGERLRFHAPLRIGDEVRRDTELLDISAKSGSTGTLVFATVINRFHTPEGLALEEERDTVFREEIAGGATNAAPKREGPPADLPWRRTVTPDPVNLFRYSALTFNGHRIHYDRAYATGAEGYPGLVVHGPFTSSLLINFARDNNPGRRMVSYEMRAKAPLFDIAPIELVGGPTGDGGQCAVWAVTPEGGIAMAAQAGFE